MGTTPGAPVLTVKCNTFVGCKNPLRIDAVKGVSGTAPNLIYGTVPTTADYTKFITTDKNDTINGNNLPGFNYSFTVDNLNATSSSKFSVAVDAVPNPAILITTNGCTTAPAADGFFRAASYRGAFDPAAGSNWLSDWSYAQIIGSSKGLVSCPTDINRDGKTDVDDFLIFGPEYNHSCN